MSKNICRISALRIAVVILYCAILGYVCVSCHSSRSASRVSTTDYHAVFDTVAAVDSIDMSRSFLSTDSTTVNIVQNDVDTIRIIRDDDGRPILIVRSHASDLLWTLDRSLFSSFDLTGLHTSGRSSTTGTVDRFEQAEEEKSTKIDPVLPLEHIIGGGLLFLVILYVIYLIVKEVWPKIK